MVPAWSNYQVHAFHWRCFVRPSELSIPKYSHGWGLSSASFATMDSQLQTSAPLVAHCWSNRMEFPVGWDRAFESLGKASNLVSYPQKCPTHGSSYDKTDTAPPNFRCFWLFSPRWCSAAITLTQLSVRHCHGQLLVSLLTLLISSATWPLSSLLSSLRSSKPAIGLSGTRRFTWSSDNRLSGMRLPAIALMPR